MILIFKVNNGVPLGYLKVVTNNQGFFSEKVPEGIYRVQAFEDYNGAGAGGGYSSDCIVSGTTVTTCDLTMLGPNASGSVTLNNNSYSITQLNFMKYESGGVVSSRVTVTPNSSGNYVAALTAGTWRTVVHYLDSTVCNINLSTNNLTVKIKSTSGSLMNSGAKISLVKYETTTVAADTFISTELESVLDARGEISLPVLDGEYSLVLAPVKPATSGVTSSLRFRVSNGVVGSFYKFDTTTVIATPANGVVTLQIPTPTISGYIYKPDGVTPLQDGMVILFQQSPVTIFGNFRCEIQYKYNRYGWIFRDTF
jgi:hypothetical protein